jgi:hypothetical protein
MSARDEAARARLAAKLAARRSDEAPDDDDAFFDKLEKQRMLDNAIRKLEIQYVVQRHVTRPFRVALST